MHMARPHDPNRTRHSGRGATRKPGGAAPRPLPEGAFRDVLLAPDRDRIPGAWPTLAFGEDEDPEFARALRERMVGRIELERRGRSHGSLAVLDPAGAFEDEPRGKRLRALQRERWVGARPLVLAGVLAAALRTERGLDERGLEDLHRRLEDPGQLLPWVRSSLRRASRFGRVEGEQPLEDADRDLARVAVEVRGASGPRGDLWVKSGRLSTFEGDRSLRVRVSFGREGDDDASRDERGHRLVADLGEALLPAARPLARAEAPRKLIEEVTGTACRFTQGIGYWNAPGGGARMHHDALGHPEADGGEDPSGQLGVLYTQVSGRTVWIALSIADLADRIVEFLGWLREGDAPWIVDEDLGGEEGLGGLLRLAADRAALITELSEPGCGRFGVLVERGQEFTGALVDAGHACVLRPGDAILLPNHGLSRTAMHAVFCASPRPAYGLSVAVRKKGGG